MAEDQSKREGRGEEGVYHSGGGEEVRGALESERRHSDMMGPNLLFHTGG